MQQWSFSRCTVPVLTIAAIALAGSVAAQTHGRLREPADVMFLAGHGVTLGLTVRDVESPDKQQGVVVEDVAPGSAAEKGGLKRGDLITALDGEQVRSARQFTRLVDEAAPGRAVRAAVVRDGRKSDVTMTPVAAERPATITIDPERIRERVREMMPNLDLDMTLPGARARLGVTVQEMTPQLAAYFGTKQGLLVSSVSDDSPASRAGLKTGDVIASIDGRSVATGTDLLHLLREAKDAQEVTINIVRDRRESTVKATLERVARRQTRQYWTGRMF
jgi:serine protease Do